MEDKIRELLKKQRENCSENAAIYYESSSNFYVDHESIHTAPEPEIDLWTKVEDGLPKKDEQYLCYVKYEYYDHVDRFREVLEYDSKDKTFWNTNFTENLTHQVTHWMPSPPKPEIA